MFESAELGHAIDKETYAKEEPALRTALLEAQYDLLNAKKFPVIILISGVEGAGKGETVNLLHEWMDPRHIRAHAFGPPTDEERERPPSWRFWRALPPKGKIGIFFTSWYTDPIVQRAYEQTNKADLDQAMESKARWRVTSKDWEHFEMYDRFRRISERSRRETSTAEAPWVVVEGTDARYRSLTVGKAILAAASRTGKRRCSSSSRSPRTTGATATSGTRTGAPCAT